MLATTPPTVRTPTSHYVTTLRWLLLCISLGVSGLIQEVKIRPRPNQPAGGRQPERILRILEMLP